MYREWLTHESSAPMEARKDKAVISKKYSDAASLEMDTGP